MFALNKRFVSSFIFLLAVVSSENQPLQEFNSEEAAIQLNFEEVNVEEINSAEELHELDDTEVDISQEFFFTEITFRGSNRPLLFPASDNLYCYIHKYDPKAYTHNEVELSNTTTLSLVPTSDEEMADIYKYVCSVGNYTITQNSTGFVTESYYTIFKDDYDVKFVYRAPRFGDSRITYIQLKFSVDSPNVNCSLTGGGIGLKDANITVNVRNSSYFSYVSTMIW